MYSLIQFIERLSTIWKLNSTELKHSRRNKIEIKTFPQKDEKEKKI